MGRLLLQDGVIDLDRGEVVRGSAIQRLTPIERELLAYLASRAGRDVGREELHQRVWGHSVRVLSRAVNLSVHRLRRKIELAPDKPIHLLTGAGGYRWVPLASEVAAPDDRVVLVVGEPTTPGDAGWLLRCVEVAREGGAYLAELAPDRVVIACGTVPAALVAATALGGLAETRIGIAAGPALCLVDPLSGRTLYGGVTLERAAALARAARPGEIPSSAADASVASSASFASPVRLDRFVGRDEVLRELLAGPRRPLAIVGPAGVGKSRLAEELVGRSGRLGWFASLDGVDLLRDAVAAVAGALGIPAGVDPIGAVGAALSVRGAVALVLDGAERVAADLGPTVARWQAEAPDALLVVTSRDRLAIPGGVLHELAGLSLADGLALVLERCPTAAPSAALEALVENLDGLPLALELVAPRLRIVAPDELLHRRDPLLDLLVRRTGDARHRSMRSALEASWERLDEHERCTLVRATAFAGGFGLDDAEAVLPRDRPGDPWFVDTLQSLCDRHLVQVERIGGRPWFRLLGTVRAFAEQHPSLLGDAERRHAERFAALREAMPRIGPPPFGAEALPDLANATRAAVRHGWPDLAARAAIAHGQGALHHRAPDESLVLVDAAIASEPGAYWLACLGNARAQLLRRAGRNQEGLDAIRAALALLVGDDELRGRLEAQHAVALTASGDDDAAHAAFDRAQALLAAAGNRELVDVVRLNRARLYERARAPDDGLRVIAPLLDAPDGLLRAYATALAGSFAAIRGDAPAAVRWLGAAVALGDAHGSPFVVANHRMILAEHLAAQGRDDDASAETRRALATMRDLGCSEQVLHGYNLLASLALAGGDPVAAGRALDDAAPWVPRCDDPGGRGLFLALLCEVRGAAGDAVGSREAADEAERWLRSGRDEAATALLAVHRGAAAVATGAADDGRDALAAAEADALRLDAHPTSALARGIRRLRHAIRDAR